LRAGHSPSATRFLESIELSGKLIKVAIGFLIGEFDRA
jgi:hypothetical protein